VIAHSNANKHQHGGRQVDGAIGILDALPGIVDAVKGKLTIGFDGGIRSGADMYDLFHSFILLSLTQRSFKALALGADFVQLGRPILWGLAHEGEKGVRHVLKSLLAELEITVGLAGYSRLKDIDRAALIENKW